jgi:hypothetical protein
VVPSTAYPSDATFEGNYFYSPVCGVPKGSELQLKCPANTFVVELQGYSSSIVDTLGLACSDGTIISPVGGPTTTNYNLNCPSGFGAGDITVVDSVWWSHNVIAQISLRCEGAPLGYAGAGHGDTFTTTTLNAPDSSYKVSSITVTLENNRWDSNYNFIGSLKFSFYSSAPNHEASMSPTFTPISHPSPNATSTCQLNYCSSDNSALRRKLYPAASYGVETSQRSATHEGQSVPQSSKYRIINGSTNYSLINQRNPTTPMRYKRKAETPNNVKRM